MISRCLLPALALAFAAGCGDVASGPPRGLGDSDGSAPDAMVRPSRPDAGIPELIDAAPIACDDVGDCGDIQLGEWSACSYTTECLETGTRQRAVGTPVCQGNGMCGFDVSIETDTSTFCSRDTEANNCGTTVVEYCGVELECRKCRSGVCAVNTPHVDAQCNPTCGYAALVCGEAGICCQGNDTCSGQSVGDGPYSDCDACCIGSC
jgi:hypothetical protein